MHVCVSKSNIIGSDNGLSPGRHQAIIWTNAGILLIGHTRIFDEIVIEIHTFSFKKIHLKMSSRKWRSFGLGLNVSKNCNLRARPAVSCWSKDRWVNIILIAKGWCNNSFPDEIAVSRKSLLTWSQISCWLCSYCRKLPEGGINDPKIKHDKDSASQLTRALQSMPIWYRSDVKVSDRYIIDIDQRVLVIWLHWNCWHLVGYAAGIVTRFL